MSSGYQVRYLPHNEIDFSKWDDCITNASNGLIYGYSYYLNHMAKHWDALVSGDYDAVMPLTWNRKYGIYYLYQPFLAAQLGVFGASINAATVEAFLQAIPSRFRYWDFYLNYQNTFPLNNFRLYQRKNLILNLNKPYEEIFNSYRENIQRNIRKAEQSGCRAVKNIEVEKVVELAKEQMKTYTIESADNVNRFTELYYQLYDRQQAGSYGIMSATNDLIASCIFIFSHNRAYYILVGNHPDGRTIGASHCLIDAFIKDNAEKEMLLDFEGSDIRNLAFFYSSFGAMEENYAGIKLNRLPFYLKWLKK
jgi:hypothetical protein